MEMLREISTKGREEGRSMRKCLVIPSCYLLMVLLFACASAPSKETGFLDNYSKLQPDPEAEGLFVYENPDKSIDEYDAFVLDPILVYFHPEAANHSVNPEKLMEATEYFRNQILSSFQGRYRIVPIAGPGVCIIRIAISGVIPEKPKMITDRNIEAFGLSDAALEVKFQDSRTGVDVLTLWDTRRHGEYKRMDVKTVMNRAKQTIQNWTKTIVDYMDKAHTKASGQHHLNLKSASP